MTCRLSLGADAPISVAGHVAVIPQIRWYHLRRLGNQTNQSLTLPHLIRQRRCSRSA